MAFLRFTRDKRGYEHFQLVQPASNSRGNSRPRVLYWFRSPPNVRVGREPFDDQVRSALEKQNPGVEFDWSRILATPIPSADAEHWRERRRLAREARRLAAAEQDELAAPSEAGASAAETRRPESDEETLEPFESEEPTPTAQNPLPVRESDRRRRKRRRGRHRRVEPSGSGTASTPAQPPASADDTNSSSAEIPSAGPRPPPDV